MGDLFAQHFNLVGSFVRIYSVFEIHCIVRCAIAIVRYFNVMLCVISQSNNYVCHC